MSARVVTGGLQTTIQDLGRVGHQRQGVPVGGAMDRLAVRLANLLIGNADGAACLEAPLIGPALTFDEETLIAITGGDLEPTIDGHPVPLWHAMWVEPGTTLRFGRAKLGARAYLAVAGGIDVAPVFESRSTYLRAAFGGCDGRALKSGDVLHASPRSAIADRMCAALRAPGRRFVAARWSISTGMRPAYGDDVLVRVLAGAHYDELPTEARSAFFDATFRVSTSSDRMGYRLDGPALALARPLELLSEGVTFGTVQLPPGGSPIVLMADAQTTGGYPRIAEVASVDLPLLAQLKPGDRLRFRLVALDHAQREYLAREADIAQARAAIAFRYGRG